MAIDLSKYKKEQKSNAPTSQPASQPTKVTSRVDLTAYKLPEKKKEDGLLKKINRGITDFADVTSANLFSGVASTAGAVEEGLGKILGLASKGAGYVGEGFYKVIGEGVGVFSEDGEKLFDQIGEDFKKNQFEFADLANQAGKDINRFLSEGGREAKEIILKDNEGYQRSKNPYADVEDKYKPEADRLKTEAQRLEQMRERIDALPSTFATQEETDKANNLIKIYNEKLDKYQTDSQKLEENFTREAQAVDEEKFSFKDLTSKDFLLYDLYGSLTENAPTMIATLYTGGVAGASTKAGTVANFIAKVGGATAFGTGVNALRESESAYSQALEEGLSKEEASERAERVFLRNTTANTGLEALQMALIFAPHLKVASPWLKTFTTTAKYTGAGATEAVQERAEDSIQAQAGNENFDFQQLYDKLTDRKITKTDAISFILGITFQGLGDVTQALNPQENSNAGADFRNQQKNFAEAEQSIKTSEAFPIAETIAESPEMEAKIYKDSENQILTQEFAQGRIDDVAQKLDFYKEGLGQEYRNLVEGTDTTYQNLIDKGLEVLNKAKGDAEINIDQNRSNISGGNVLLEKAYGEQVEQIADRLPDDGQGGTAEERVERAIETDPDGTAEVVRQVQEEIRSTPARIQQEAENARLPEQAEALLQEGQSPAQVTLQIANQVGAVQAREIVAQAQENLKAVKDTTDTLQGLLDKTPADLQADFNANQEQTNSTLSDIRGRIKDIQDQLRDAPARSPLKKKLKTQLTQERQRLASAEKRFDQELESREQGVRDELGAFLDTVPNINITTEQRQQLIDRAVGRIVNPTSREALSSIKSILRNEYVNVVQKAPAKKETGKKTKVAKDKIEKRGKIKKDEIDKAPVKEEKKVEKKEEAKEEKKPAEKKTEEKKTEKKETTEKQTGKANEKVEKKETKTEDSSPVEGESKLTGEKLLTMTKKEIAPLLVDKLNIEDKGGTAIQKVGVATPLKSFDLPTFARNGGLVKLAEQGVFSDSFTLINDKAETKKLLAEAKKRTENIEVVDREVPDWKQIIPKERTKAEIQGYVVDGTFQPRVVAVLTDGNIQQGFDTDRLAYIMKAFPNAEMFFSGERRPLVFEEKGKIKALLMPRVDKQGNDFKMDDTQSQDVTPAKLSIKEPFKATDEFKEAVANTEGAELTSEGITLDIARYQKEEQAGQDAIRGGVFYLPELSSPYKKYYTTGKNGYGGGVLVTGRTTFKNPLISKAGTGGIGVKKAYDQIKGKGAYDKMRSEVLDKVVGFGLQSWEIEENVYNLIEKYGGNPDLTYDIVMHSQEGNTLPYAVQEHIAGHAVREAGYDAIISHSTANKKPRLSEVFDLRATEYPTTEQNDFTYDDFYESSEAKLQKKVDALNLTKEQGELHAEMQAVLMDSVTGALTKQEADTQLKALWEKAQKTFTDEQLAVLDMEARLRLKRHDVNNTNVQDRFKFLEDIKRRWKIDFDVHFVDTIFAGESIDKQRTKSAVEAWGAYADNSIAIVRNALENTDRHEVVHLTMDNAHNIQIMKDNGITKRGLLEAKAKEQGLEYKNLTAKQRVELEEQIAKDFESYRENKYEPKGLIQKFYVLLQKLIEKAKKLLNLDTAPDIITEYYDLLEFGQDVNAEIAYFENRGILSSYIEDGVLDLRGSEIAVNFDNSPREFKKLTVTRLKKKDADGDKRLEKIIVEHNKAVRTQEELEKNTEAWRADIEKEAQRQSKIAKEVEATPEEVKELSRFTTKKPPKGELTKRGEERAEELEFANPEEAQKEITAYMERKREIIATRNKLRDIRRRIQQAKKLGKENRSVLRDIEKRLKARQQFLERKDRHKAQGRREQMRFIAKRGRILRETQDFLGLSDSKAKQIIGGIGRQRIHTMTEKEFNDFMIKFMNQGTDIMNRLGAQDSVKALIQEMQFQNEDNVRKALKLPTISKMSKAQAEQFERVLEQYEFGDKFLTTRQLETIHRTQWGDVRTEREMHEKIQKTTGISREDLASVEVQSDIQKFKNWLVLSRSNPMFAWLVDRRIKAKVQQKAEFVAFEKELNPLVRKARNSRKKGIKKGVIDAIAPTDEIVFDYLEAENKPEFAEKNQMTQEELDLAHFLMGRLFEPARQYMTTEYGMKDRDNYITHIRRDIVETFFDAIREGRGARAGVKDAIREIFTSQAETEQQFKILAGKTGEVLAFEKFFQFAMPRTGNLKPTKNVARASLAYANAYFNKKALDELIPEAVALTKVQEQIKGYTEKGLPKDPTVKAFVDQFINDAKGRKIEFITQQGSGLDSALRLGVAWTAFKYLGFRPIIGMVNFVGEFVGTMRGTTTREKWRGLARTLNLKKAHRVNQAHQYFTGRNPLVEILDPQYGIATKIKNTAMVLFSLSTYFNNQFYLRAKMSPEEWQAEIVQDERMVEFVKEMTKWRNTDFYIKSLAGNTATGSVFSQFATWAIPIVTTTMSDMHQMYKDVQRDGAKGLTQEHARSFGKTLIYVGGIAMVAQTLKQAMDVDENERDIWFYITRELNTLMGAFQTVWDLEGRAPILRDVLNLQKLIVQTLTAEKYKVDGEGYGVGDWKARVTARKFIEPIFIRDARESIFGEPERENTKNRLIDEAIEKGEVNPDEILNFISPDEWNNTEGKRTPEEHAEYQEKKRGEIQALYHERKEYADSQVAEIVHKESRNAERVAGWVELAKETSVEEVDKEIKALYHDRNLCIDTKKKTGCLISGQLFKEWKKAKKDLQ